jgi:hypothetical protein
VLCEDGNGTYGSNGIKEAVRMRERSRRDTSEEMATTGVVNFDANPLY